MRFVVSGARRGATVALAHLVSPELKSALPLESIGRAPFGRALEITKDPAIRLHPLLTYRPLSLLRRFFFRWIRRLADHFIAEVILTLEFWDWQCF